MSKVRYQEDNVHLRLLEQDSLVSEPSWSSHAGFRIRVPPSRTSFFTDTIRHKRRRRIWLGVIVLVSFLAILVALFVSRKPIEARLRSAWNPSWQDASSHFVSQVQNISLYIEPVQTPRFRDNLRNDTKYVTASPIGGFSNQVMAQINLLYIAILTGRVPVIADFVPGHMHGNPGFLAVSEVYDLPRLADALRMPIIEWSDIKDRSSHELEDIGCWSLQTILFGPDYGTKGHFATEHEFSLDISLTPVPDSRFIPGTNHLNIMAVASLGWPDARADALVHVETISSPINKHTTPPDEHLLCFDELYYAASVKPYEWFEEWVPAWTQVGRYMHWTPPMEALARKYILRAFGLNDGDPFPSYISVHIRHTDFVQMCKDDDCFPPLSTYGAKVDEIKADLLELHGVNIDKVLVASDEEDPVWWQAVQDFGWYRIDWVAERTEEMYSEWHPIVLDSVALSLGKGIVGTTRSTLSLLAAKRVQDWEGGLVREVHLETT
ncbi:hypothetical protein K439DRAFT_1397924 [Ramaria rubella]|nr:hypothetical protein K439DRAFT_1397924 [Ramaria rubella]